MCLMNHVSTSLAYFIFSKKWHGPNDNLKHTASANVVKYNY